jgi:hypothetical protein
MNEEQKGLPHDIAEILPFGGFRWEFVWGALLGLLILCLVAWLVKKWLARPRKDAAALVVEVDPWTALATKLRSLKASEPFGAAEQKDYFYQLSLYFREGIELATSIRATDMTVGEVRSALQNAHRFTSEDKDKMVGFLNETDFVKFAERTVTVDDAKLQKEFVEAWIRKLKPRPLPSQDVRGQG